MPTLFVLLGLGFVALKLVKFSATLLVYVVATAMVVYHERQSFKIAKVLLAQRPDAVALDSAGAWRSTRAQRRLMARHLHHAICLTELRSLFPTSGARGCAIAQAMMMKPAA